MRLDTGTSTHLNNPITTVSPPSAAGPPTFLMGRLNHHQLQEAIPRIGPREPLETACLVSWEDPPPSEVVLRSAVSLLGNAPTLSLNQKLVVTFYARLDRATDWFVSHIYGILLILILSAIAQRIGNYLIDQLFGVIHLGLGKDTAERPAQRARTLATIVRSTFRAAVIFTTVLVLLGAVGINMTPVLASAGILGLAVGFGAQSLIKDVINGFFILSEDQYGVGDVVTVAGYSGLVERMNLRITQVRNGDGNLISIPNGTVGVVSNHTKDWARAVVAVNVAIQEDIDRVLAILREEGRKLYKDLPGKVLDEPAVYGPEAMDESAMTFKVDVKTAPTAQAEVARACRNRVKHAFEREQVALPLPQRVLWMGNPADVREVTRSLPPIPADANMRGSKATEKEVPPWI